jgi:thioredoxin 1
MVLRSSKPVMVMFHLPACPHCRAMQKPVEDIARDMAAEMNVARLNVSENPSTSSKYGIRGVPTFIMFITGNAVSTITGEMPEQSLYDWAKKALADGESR